MGELDFSLWSCKLMVQERYVCIEPGYVSEFKTLKPEERFIGQQVLSTF
jgi:hypothetical protein